MALITTPAKPEANPETMSFNRHLGGGVIANVWSGDGLVIKKARRSDSTRSYLEWVMWRVSQGRRMPGMPQVHMVVEIDGKYGEKGYIAIMDRCDKTVAEHLGKTVRWDQMRDVAPAYIGELADAFVADTGCDCDDMHGRNVMLCGDEWVLIDPACGDYRKPDRWPVFSPRGSGRATWSNPEPVKATCSVPQKLPEDHPAKRPVALLDNITSQVLAGRVDWRVNPFMQAVPKLKSWHANALQAERLRHMKWQVHNGVMAKPEDEAVPALNETPHELSAPDIPVVKRHANYLAIMDEMMRPVKIERMPDPRRWAPGLWVRPDHLRLDRQRVFYPAKPAGP